MRTLVPGYPAVLAGARARRATSHDFADALRRPGAAARRPRPAGLDLLVLDAPHLYDRPGNPYLGPDGARLARQLRAASPRSAAPRPRSAAALVAGCAARHRPRPRLAGRPRARLPALRRRAAARHGASPSTTSPSRASSRPTCFGELGLPPHAFAIDGVEYYGGVGFLKAGLAYADRHHHGQPDLRRRRSRPPSRRHGPRRPAARRAPACCTASSTASTTDGLEPGDRPASRRALRRRRRSPAAPPTSAAVAGALRPRRRADAPLFVRGQPADLAEGHRPAAWMHCRRLSAAAAQLAVLGTATPALEAGFRAAAARASRPGRRASSATTSRSPT